MSSGTITPGDSSTIGTLSIGSLTITGGTLNILLGGGSTSLLAVNGSATLGGTIDFSTNAALTNSTYTFLTYTGTRTGAFTTTNNLPSGYGIYYGSNSVYLQVLANMAIVTNTFAGTNAIITGGSTNFSVVVTNSIGTNGVPLVFTGSAGTNVTGSIGSSTVSPQGSGTFSGFTFSNNTVGLNQQGSYTLTSSNATPTTTNGTVSVDVYDHATGSLSTNAVAFSNVIVGYSNAVTTILGISNASGTRVDLAATNIGGVPTNETFAGVTNVTQGTSSNTILTFKTGQGTGTYSNDVTVTFGDASTLSGASNNLGSQTISVVENVYDHAAGSLSTNSIALSNVIVGYGSSVVTDVGLTNSNGFRVALAATNITTGATNLTLGGVGSLTAGSGTTTALTFAAGQGTGTYSNNVSVTYADASSLNGASTNLGSQTITVTQSVFGHAAGSLSTNAVVLSNVIVGYTGTVATNVGLTNSNGFRVALEATNITTGATNLTLVGVGSLTAGSGTTTALTFAAGQGTGTYSNNVSVTYADASGFLGASTNLGSQTITVTQNVYDHAAGSLSTSTLSVGDVIVGYSGTLTNSLVVSNAAGFRVGLNATNDSSGALTLQSATNLAAGNSLALGVTLANGQGTGTYNSNVTVTYADAANYNGASTNLGTSSVAVTANIFGHAAGSLSTNAVVLSNVIVGYGSSVVTDVGLTNSNGFRVALAATNITTGATNLTLGGVGSLTAGSGTTTALTFAAGQGTGTYSNNVSVTYADASSLNGASTNLGSQTITVTQSVFGHASNILSTNSVALQAVHVGYTNTQTNTIGMSNAVGFRVAMQTATTNSSNGISLSGVTGVSNGVSSNAILTFATNQGVGAFTNQIGVVYGDASSYAGAITNYGTNTLTVSGLVYSGQSTWTAGSGNWTNFTNWSALGGTPGLDGTLSTNDTATFGTGSGGTVTLNTNAQLNTLSFSNASAYTVTGTGSISLVQGSSAPSITTTLGSHTISNADRGIWKPCQEWSRNALPHG